MMIQNRRTRRYWRPDLVIEILFPKSNKEMKYKFDLYEEAGVLEYWIVNPADKTVLFMF
jgi:Uma2 family endonuclease